VVYPVGVTLPEHLRGDGPCADCGTLDNIVWFTDNVLWYEVVRRVDVGREWSEILCIPCFVKRVDAAGFAPTGWRLVPDWHWETRAEYDRRRAVTHG
jgi:hypothetical protein